MGGRQHWTDSSHNNQFFSDSIFAHSHVESMEGRRMSLQRVGQYFRET